MMLRSALSPYCMLSIAYQMFQLFSTHINSLKTPGTACIHGCRLL